MDQMTMAKLCAQKMWDLDKASQGMGIVVESVGPGKAVMSMKIRDEMSNGHGICHGGFIFALADTAFAFACNSQNQVTVGISCDIDYISPVHIGDVIKATAKKVHQGGRSGLYDVVLTNLENSVVATFRGRSVRVNRTILDENVI